jgi:hypothetical protein
MSALERRSSGDSSISVSLEDLEREQIVPLVQNTAIITFK